MSSTGSFTRPSRSGRFLVQIVGLPREYTWKDLKDLIRPRATHSIWTDVGVVHRDGHSFSTHRIRLGLYSEAQASYTHICQQKIAGRKLFVELWDVSEPDAEPMLIQRNFDSTPGSMQSQSREVNRLAQGSSWIQVVPSYSQTTMIQAPMPGQMPPTPMTTPRFHVPQAIQTNYAAPQLTPAQLAQLQPYQAQQAYLQQVSIQQQPVPTTYNGRTATGLPVNTQNGAAIVEPRAVFVKDLDYKARESDVEALFNTAGRVVSCRIQVDQKTRKSKGCAKVEYNSTQEAQRAVQILDGEYWMERKLHVRLDRDTTVVSPPTAATNNQRPLIVNGSLGGRSRSRNER